MDNQKREISTAARVEIQEKKDKDTTLTLLEHEDLRLQEQKQSR